MMTNALANTVLTSSFSTVTHYLALHSTDPTAAGLAGGEISGGSYGRQSVNWTTPSNRTVVNNNTVTWTNLPATTVNFMAVWTAASGGSCLYVIPVNPPGGIVFASGGNFVVPISDIAIVLQ